MTDYVPASKKVCAHCGGAAQIPEPIRLATVTFSVECSQCGMTTGPRSSLFEALAAWNQRRPAPAPAVFEHPAARGEQTEKAPVPEKKTSRFKGVCWCKTAKRWIAYTGGSGNRQHVGRFTDEVEAAKAVNEALLKRYGPDAVLNKLD